MILGKVVYIFYIWQLINKFQHKKSGNSSLNIILLSLEWEDDLFKICLAIVLGIASRNVNKQ